MRFVLQDVSSLVGGRFGFGMTMAPFAGFSDQMLVPGDVYVPPNLSVSKQISLGSGTNAPVLGLHGFSGSGRSSKKTSINLEGVEEVSGDKTKRASKQKKKILVLHPFPTSWEFIKEAYRFGFEVWATPPGEMRLPNDVLDSISGQTESSIYDIDGLSKEAVRMGDVAMFYPGSEMAVLPTAKLSSTFSLPGNPKDVALSTRYKDLMRQALNLVAPDHNPRYALVTDRNGLVSAAREIGFPSVFKRTDFAGSYGVRLVHNMEELESFYDDQAAIETLPFGEPVRQIFLLEEYIDGQEYSVESVTIEGNTTILGVTKKSVSEEPFFVEAKHEFPAQYFGTSNEEVQIMSALAKTVTESLGLNFCVSHFEVRWDSSRNRPMIMELASRAGGDNIPTLLREVIGIHTWDPLLQYLEGRRGDECFRNVSPKRAASVQFVAADRSGTFRGVSNMDAIVKHPAHLSHTISHESGKRIDVSNTYKDRVAHFIGSSSDVDMLKSYQKVVDAAMVMVD